MNIPVTKKTESEILTGTIICFLIHHFIFQAEGVTQEYTSTMYTCTKGLFY